ncbi:hypothetical protein EH240_22395 [Mesorhizobium tamadayense]|uniref:RepB plasmid partition domain-containing protein n=1 Tax=Mesorhizobium tamadayense TaxID=425306 RepID=A0A3P3FDH4_9HYPH|nr:hypothetical protein EH240_22395 [Mesorhizobium tamadayense]
MEAEFAELSSGFRNAAGSSGTWNLELVAARGYLDRLMGNVRVVRYLENHFPQRFAEFQSIFDPPRAARIRRTSAIKRKTPG